MVLSISYILWLGWLCLVCVIRGLLSYQYVQGYPLRDMLYLVRRMYLILPSLRC